MGNTLAPMQQELTAINTHAGDDAREILARLEEMAQDRIDLFYDRIGHKNHDKHLIPINKVLSKYTYIGVSSKTNPILWSTHVKDAVNEFSTGHVAEGFTLLANNTIERMISKSAAKCQVEQRYAISMDPLGGISRLDYFIFTYSFRTSELIRREACLVACCVVESSAVVTDLDANTLRVIISRTFKGGDVPYSMLTAIHSQLITAIKEPKEGYKFTKQEENDLVNWYKAKPQQKVLHQGSVSTTHQHHDTPHGAHGTFPDKHHDAPHGVHGTSLDKQHDTPHDVKGTSPDKHHDTPHDAKGTSPDKHHDTPNGVKGTSSDKHLDNSASKPVKVAV
ncbi:hypothetical protein BDM02DRAFT_3125829 [Thelephora ganbajun]|uniref:Uncharacterized protein n=1 Tax=Thelephora ganbajun TaxID=370292 RepID=A0ACB6ZVF5_THEGA|nr:hypothetical protein BDM02DRAFT_3125829 [Thelephora ganbajun]